MNWISIFKSTNIILCSIYLQFEKTAPQHIGSKNATIDVDNNADCCSYESKRQIEYWYWGHAVGISVKWKHEPVSSRSVLNDDRFLGNTSRSILRF